MAAFARRIFMASACVLAMASNVPKASADGMVPDSTVVIVDEAQGEASITVTNTDAVVGLLNVTLENIPEDDETLLFVTPPLSRVEAGKRQLVRFVLANDTPLTTQRLKRVIIEGISPQRAGDDEGSHRVLINLRQDLPVLLHPKGLKRKADPWTDLRWSIGDATLHVENDSPYVVRLVQAVHLLPAREEVVLPRTYLLPGERLTIPAPGISMATAVRLYPATAYGFAVDAHDAVLHLY